MSEGRYTRLGTVSQVRDRMGQKITTQRKGAPAEVIDHSPLERSILSFIDGMPPDADVHIEVSKDLWR